LKLQLVINQSNLLPLAKGQGIALINFYIGETRKRFITSIPGQDMIYLEKEREAKDYLALEEEPETLQDFPFIAADVGVTAPTPFQVAQVYMNLASAWKVIGPQLEYLRLTTIKAVNEETSTTRIKLIVETLKQTLEAV
jgi:hypothetical protein